MKKTKKTCRLWCRKKNYNLVTMIISNWVKIDDAALFNDWAKNKRDGYYGFQAVGDVDAPNARVGITFTFKSSVDRENWKEILKELETRNIIFGLTFDED